jgi:hypothetical protein
MLEKAMDTFLKYDGSISLADASSIEIMRKIYLLRRIGADRGGHWKVAGG